MNLGYLVGTESFAAVFIVFAIAPVSAKRFQPLLYWSTIIATTTVGTTLADFADRSLGIGIGWYHASWRASAVCIDEEIGLDRLGRHATLKGDEVEFTPREFALLTYLARKSGRVVPRSAAERHDLVDFSAR